MLKFFNVILLNLDPFINSTFKKTSLVFIVRIVVLTGYVAFVMSTSADKSLHSGVFLNLQELREKCNLHRSWV